MTQVGVFGYDALFNLNAPLLTLLSQHSSITLVGELLYKVSGISGKNEIDEDEAGEADAVAAESSRRALVDVLGKDRRDRILGSLYIIRQDAISAVRQASIHIWKALVHNTPREGKCRQFLFVKD